MIKGARVFIGCLVLLVLSGVTIQLQAQYRDNLGGNWNNPASSMITNIIMDRYARDRLKRNLEAKRNGNARGGPASTSEPSAAAPNDSVLHFRSTGTELKTREIANLIGPNNPQVATLMTAILQEYEKNARAAGKPNDLALALSFFLATNANVYHDVGQPSDAQMMEFRSSIAQALIEGDALRSMTDRQKQEMYESLVLFTGFALAAYQEGKQTPNADSVKVGRQLAGQNLQAVVGISPDKIRFSAKGLTIDADAPAAAPQAAPETNTAVAQGPTSQGIGAGQLVIEFEGNELRANQLYGGKRIRVTGRINSIDVLKDSRAALTFHSPAGGFAQTRCIFSRAQSARLAAYRGGQEVTVEGTVIGLAGGLGGKGFVELDDCVVP